jgi:ribonuclease-3
LDKVTPEQRLELLCQRLHLEDADPVLLLEALTHKSYGNEHKVASHNERLEFLGDAVLDLAVSQRLMERFPRASEGELSKLRALLVSEEALARVGRRVGLGELLLLGRGEELTGGREKSSVLADALEAVLGAVYLANGLPAAQAVVDATFEEAFREVEEKRAGEDFKSRLQEYGQLHHRQAPRYRVVSESGPDHDKRFEVEVAIGDTVRARGAGRSKKEAEQAAAQKTLALLVPLEQKESPEDPT